MEQGVFSKDRDDIINACKAAGLKAVITCCASPRDWDITKSMVRRYDGFVFACASIHPEYVKDISELEANDFMGVLRNNKDSIVAVGETGLDYWYTKEPEWREKQAGMFRKFIALSKEIDKPLVIHARDAYEEVVNILEQENAKKVMLHMFGASHLVKRVIDNGWHVSMNAIVLRSKKHGKVVRNMPVERLMLETDSPWLHPSGGGRNDPRSIKAVAEKIAEIKKVRFDEVWEMCAQNAIKFFGLPIV